MGHSRLKVLDSGAELWTGDEFEYLYVRFGDEEHHLPPEVLYQTLANELRGKVISAAEGCGSWKKLAAALQVLDPDA